MALHFKKSYLKNENGFTLIETLVAFAIFFIVSTSATHILLFASNASTKIYGGQELLENARVAIEFIDDQVKCGYDIELETYPGTDTLKKLSITSDERVEPFVFKYDNRLTTTSDRYHRIEYGAGSSYDELASYIKDVTVKIDEEKETMTITILTDESISKDDKKNLEPIFLTKVIDIQYKNILN